MDITNLKEVMLGPEDLQDIIVAGLRQKFNIPDGARYEIPIKATYGFGKLDATILGIKLFFPKK